MTSVVEHDDIQTSHQSRAWARRAVPAILIVALVVSLGLWWFQGGVFVSASQGITVGAVGEAGERLSVGVIVHANSDGAKLRWVTADAQVGANVTWSVYQGKNGHGFGTAKGPLEPTWPVESVPGHAVSADIDDTTFLIATITAARPGVYRLSGITVEYRSGWRHRTVHSGYTACFLVTSPGQTYQELEAADAPDWQRYRACNGGNT
jgi:hypothetical protein